MELGFWWIVSSTALIGGFVAVCWLLKSVNEWYYVSKLGGKGNTLPPGDMGWPLIGNMWSFLFAFKWGDPDSFVSSFVSRFGRTGIYRAYMFGNPTIIVTMPETCRRVLMDDERFKQGWPKSTCDLMGKKSFLGISDEEHKRLRRLTAAPINGHKALSVYHEHIRDIVVNSLDKWTKEERPIEFLTEIKKITFKIIMYIFLGSEIDPMMKTLEKEYAILNNGLRAMAINLPGFAYHEALKARRTLVNILQDVVDERRARKGSDISETRKSMMDLLMEVEDENGRKLDDEEIIDIILMYLNAGHESSAHATMWATLLLHQHPECLQKARAEQVEIVRRRSSSDEGLSFKEIKQMEYLSKGHKSKAGTFIPFGTGSRICPGSDLTKLEISTFLHYFLLNYELELLNPGSGVRYLPHSSPIDNCLANIKKLISPSSSTQSTK